MLDFSFIALGICHPSDRGEKGSWCGSHSDNLWVDSTPSLPSRVWGMSNSDLYPPCLLGRLPDCPGQFAKVGRQKKTATLRSARKELYNVCHIYTLILKGPRNEGLSWGPPIWAKDLKGPERTWKNLKGPERTWKDLKGPPMWIIGFLQDAEAVSAWHWRVNTHRIE